METEKQKKNPLKSLWNILGTVGGIISFSSMVDGWASDLLKWKGFIGSIIESYRSVVIPVSEFLFGWLPWSVPLWITDYLILGIIYAVSLKKGIEDPNYPLGSLSLKERAKYISYILPLGLGLVLLWPYWLCMHVWEYFEERPADFRSAFLWFGAIILGFLVLLAINSYTL